MRLSRLAGLGPILLAASMLSAEQAAGEAGVYRGRYGLSVVVDGSAAAEYPFRGKTYIEAVRGRSFTLRVTNPTSERVAVAVSVDGRNVIDARRSSASAATKWVLSPGQILDIPGWQVSGQTARRFFFTDTGRSYAQWLGDTANVGTIEAVFFRERVRRPQALAPYREPSADEAAGDSEGQAKSREAAPIPPGTASGSAGTGREGARREMAQARPTEADRFAATGIGERTENPIEWVEFQEDPAPAARVSLRYEFRSELVRLGVLPRADDLFARERGRGFEPEYAPDPGRNH